MKIKVIVKSPEEDYGRMLEIENELSVFQKIVGGYIETTGRKNLIIICNEEGKLRGMKPNLAFGTDLIVGTIIVCGASGDEFADIPIDFKKWEQIVNMSATDTWKEFEQ